MLPGRAGPGHAGAAGPVWGACSGSASGLASTGARSAPTVGRCLGRPRRLSQTSRTTTWMMPATGMARSAPRMPAGAGVPHDPRQLSGELDALLGQRHREQREQAAQQDDHRSRPAERHPGRHAAAVDSRRSPAPSVTAGGSGRPSRTCLALTATRWVWHAGDLLVSGLVQACLPAPDPGRPCTEHRRRRGHRCPYPPCSPAAERADVTLICDRCDETTERRSR